MSDLKYRTMENEEWKTYITYILLFSTYFTLYNENFVFVI